MAALLGISEEVLEGYELGRTWIDLVRLIEIADIFCPSISTSSDQDPSNRGGSASQPAPPALLCRGTRTLRLPAHPCRQTAAALARMMRRRGLRRKTPAACRRSAIPSGRGCAPRPHVPRLPGLGAGVVPVGGETDPHGGSGSAAHSWGPGGVNVFAITLDYLCANQIIKSRAGRTARARHPVSEFARRPCVRRMAVQTRSRTAVRSQTRRRNATIASVIWTHSPKLPRVASRRSPHG